MTKEPLLLGGMYSALHKFTLASHRPWSAILCQHFSAPRIRIQMGVRAAPGSSQGQSKQGKQRPLEAQCWPQSLQYYWGYICLLTFHAENASHLRETRFHSKPRTSVCRSSESISSFSLEKRKWSLFKSISKNFQNTPVAFWTHKMQNKDKWLA